MALNFQTPGYEMDLNAGRFLINGQCGYVLKPACLRQHYSTFDPENPGPPQTTLIIKVGRGPSSEEGGGQAGLVLRGVTGLRCPCNRPQVLTAQQLPKVKEKPSSIVDPLVRIEIHGVPADCDEQETDFVLNNGGAASQWAWPGGGAWLTGRPYRGTVGAWPTEGGWSGGVVCDGMGVVFRGEWTVGVACDGVGVALREDSMWAWPRGTGRCAVRPCR